MSDGTATQAVAVVTGGYFMRHIKCQIVVAGVQSAKFGQTVFVLDGTYDVLAHELAHTYGVNEGYNYQGTDACSGVITDPDIRVNGYNTELREPVVNAFDVMSVGKTHKIIHDAWLTKDDFETIFKNPQTLINPADPEILLLTGLITKDGGVEFNAVDRLPEGLPSVVVESNYSLDLLDTLGNVAQTTRSPRRLCFASKPLTSYRNELRHIHDSSSLFHSSADHTNSIQRQDNNKSRYYNIAIAQRC